MINSKDDLKEYIRADEVRYGVMRKPAILGWFLGDEGYVVKKYLRLLRKLEYYTNKKKKVWDYVPFIYYFLRFRRARIKTGIQLNVNTIGKGLYIPHYAGGIYANCVCMGENCIISSGCVLGNKGGVNGGKPTIGNNVEITIGAKIIGGVFIGDNVIIAPNSVVIKDVPNNAIVSGIPAKIIKIKEQ